MGTPYEKIYANLLPKFKDYDIPLMTVEEVKDMLQDFIVPAVARFHACYQDLSDRDDDNESEDDLNITTSTAVTNPNTTIPQTTVIEITEVITNINETIPLESVTTNNRTPVQEKEQKHQKKHNKQQIKEQKQEKVYQQNQTVDMMKDSNVIDIVNETEVNNNLIQNMIIMFQKENESKISVMGFGLCLVFVACFVGLFVFSTQYKKTSKKIFFTNEGMTDYLLFKENQQIQLTEKSITDI